MAKHIKYLFPALLSILTPVAAWGNYDTHTGRFLTRDPIGYADGMNLYQYVQSSPVCIKDPIGMLSDEDCMSQVFELTMSDPVIIRVMERIRRENGVYPGIECGGCCDDGCDGGCLGYQSGAIVVICNNTMGPDDDIRSTLLHELIHAYDTVLEWPYNANFFSLCQHCACTEIRAATQDGDCDWALSSPARLKMCVLSSALRAMHSMEDGDEDAVCPGPNYEVLLQLYDSCSASSYDTVGPLPPDILDYVPPAGWDDTRPWRGGVSPRIYE